MKIMIRIPDTAESFRCAVALLLVSAAFSQAREAASFDHMLPAYCLAGNAAPDPEALGGYARCDNLPKRIDPADASLREGVYLEVVGPGKEPFAGRFDGVEIRLVNNGRERLVLPASDSRLRLFQEARDADGEWKPLEFFPRSWCGNSGHHVYLEPGYYFSFIAPKYSGPFKTRLRFSLVAATAERVRTPHGIVTLNHPSRLYSQEFDGGINPGQFRRNDDRGE
jgi:hypothetical protein